MEKQSSEHGSFIISSPITYILVVAFAIRGAAPPIPRPARGRAFSTFSKNREPSTRRTLLTLLHPVIAPHGRIVFARRTIAAATAAALYAAHDVLLLMLILLDHSLTSECASLKYRDA